MEDDNSKAKYHVQDNSDIEEGTLGALEINIHKELQRGIKASFVCCKYNPDSDVYVDIGSCYYMLKDYTEAIEYWNRAIDLDHKNSKPYANLGNLHFKNGEIEMAISYWLVALISRPEDANTCLNLAIAFNQKMMRFESIKYFERYIKYAEDKFSDKYLKVKHKITHCFNVANQYLTLGAQFHSQNQEKKAAACYFKSLANYPNLSKTNLNLGSIFFSDKNLELAIKYWKIASHIDQNYDKIYSNLAISYDL